MQKHRDNEGKPRTGLGLADDVHAQHGLGDALVLHCEGEVAGQGDGGVFVLGVECSVVGGGVIVGKDKVQNRCEHKDLARRKAQHNMACGSAHKGAALD